MGEIVMKSAAFLLFLFFYCISIFFWYQRFHIALCINDSCTYHVKVGHAISVEKYFYVIIFPSIGPLDILFFIHINEFSILASLNAFASGWNSFVAYVSVNWTWTIGNSSYLRLCITEMKWKVIRKAKLTKKRK